MTVSYNLDVSSSSSVGFIKLLFRWRGSVWKSVYKELGVWIFFYYAIFSVYRYALNADQQKTFGRIAQGCDKELTYIPLTFLLGFFVSIIVQRWRMIMLNMGWIENNALNIATIVRGSDEETVQLRRTVVRLLVLSQVLVFRNISMKVRRRFPTHESIVRAGFMEREELEMLRSISIPFNKYWAPIEWASMILYRKHEKDKIPAAFFNTLLTEIRVFRNQLAQLVNYDWVPIPLAYPQVVFLAVRVYFLICLVSRQFLIVDNPNGVDIYVPVITIVQFIFLTGWMKVAEALLNPLGEDDDDFECNFLIDKNIATGLVMVDFSYDKCPAVVKDRLSDKKFMKSRGSRKDMIKGSAAAVKLKDSEDHSSFDDASIEVAENETTVTRGRAKTMTQKIGDIFSISSEEKEFDKNGEYSTRYFSQMSRY